MSLSFLADMPVSADTVVALHILIIEERHIRSRQLPIVARKGRRT